MDIGAPYKFLGQANTAELASRVAALSLEDWDARPIRRASLAGAAHNAAHSIVLKHEWTPAASRRGFQSIQESLSFWCERKGRSTDGMFPLSRQENNATTVYTFEDWKHWASWVQPIIDATMSKLANANNPVLIRALLIRLDGKGVVPYHIDEQELARVTHRIHVCLSNSPGCIYKIDGHHFSMVPGGIYDFNNRVKHGVENRDTAPRLNMMLEILPNAEWVKPEEAV